jgi:DNA-binding XRE family transcriptional regulator
MRLSKNIKYLRKSSVIGQEELGKIVGLTKAAVASWENGRTVPLLKVAIKLAAHFGVTLEELLYHDFEKDGFPRAGENEQLEIKTALEVVGRLRDSAVSMEALKQSDHTSFVLLGGRD